MLSANTDSDFFGIGNPKVSQLFGLVVLVQGLQQTVRWYLENETWWRALQDRAGGGDKLGVVK
jgi:hypothetical protein